jgi:Zn-finger nucleic acid-binding protein
VQVVTWLWKPYCPVCGFQMVTVVKSVVNVDELVK